MDAVKIADIKYPKDKGCRVAWVFDNSVATMLTVRMP